MIRQSFIFLDKINYKTEKNIRLQTNDWNKFLQTKKIKGLSEKRKIFYNQKIREASNALINYDSSYFRNMKETWRLYNYFKEDAIFIDIEISRNYKDITVIGLFDGIDTKIMVKNFNLDKNLLKNELLKYKLIITFNGGSFDLPAIKKYFKDTFPPIPHIDLRHLCARIGLKKGLKNIEKELGIERPNIIKDLYGGDPALLWRKFMATGNNRFLELLVEYNEEDIINLKKITDYTIQKLSSEFMEFKELN